MVAIKEDYVSFEIAKLLKEKGFDEKCSFVWMLDKANNPEDTDGVYKISSSHFMEGESYISNEDIDKVLEYSDEYYNKDAFLCPTLQMAMKWLRVVHNLFIEIKVGDNEGKTWYDYDILPINGKLIYWKGLNVLPPTIECNAPEEAIEIGLKYCLENLI